MTYHPRTLSLRAKLIEHTREIHEALHVHPTLQPLVAGTAAKADVARVLTAYLLVYGNVEGARQRGDWWPGIDLQAPLSALQADLQHLGENPGPIHNAGTSPEGRMACLGALYVLLGAQFGAPTIQKCLKQALPTFQSQYFAPCPRSSNAWRLLNVELRKQSLDQDEIKAILAGASDTFAMIDGALRR